MNKSTKTYREEFSKIKQEVLIRDNFTCLLKSQEFCFPPLTVDHIRKRSLRGNNNMKNLITLCSGHHDYVEQLPTRKKEELLYGILAKKYGYKYEK